MGSTASAWLYALLAGALLGIPAAAAAAPPLGEPRIQSAPAEDFLRYMVSGGPPKDGIPSIDQPEFWSAEEADRYLDAGDIVFGVHQEGDARAYPQRILVWHEIVNDTVGGRPISVTYCPLTGTALGFDRGDTELGVSGRLVNSNMIMYDRATDSFFPQILAIGIQGPLEGKPLAERRVVWTTWERWRARHPETQVLSTRTGYARNYRRDPYGRYNPVEGYYRPHSGTMFDVMHEDNRFPAKQMVLGFRTEQVAVAVLREFLREEGIVTMEHEGTHFTILHDPGLDTGWVYRSEAPLKLAAADVSFGPDGPQADALEQAVVVHPFEAMWFAWAAFYPDTVVLGAGDG
jgi:hypothetical protein